MCNSLRRASCCNQCKLQEVTTTARELQDIYLYFPLVCSLWGMVQFPSFSLVWTPCWLKQRALIHVWRLCCSSATCITHVWVTLMYLFSSYQMVIDCKLFGVICVANGNGYHSLPHNVEGFEAHAGLEDLSSVCHLHFTIADIPQLLISLCFMGLLSMVQGSHAVPCLEWTLTASK